MSGLLEHARTLVPELLGGFAGYWLHHWHHKLYARAVRLIGRARHGRIHT